MKSQIVSTDTPALKVTRTTSNSFGCPNCRVQIELGQDDSTAVGRGDVVKCESCGHSTYYPFDRPWYKSGKAVASWFFSVVVVGILVGVAGNYIYAKYFSDAGATQSVPTKSK